jgi:hypothetical protein
MLKADGRLHLDFAGMTSPAYEQLITEYGSEGTKSVLQLQHYYLGVGGSGRLSASVALAGAEIGGYAAYGAYRSIDGFDRYDTPLDVANTDAIIEFGANATYTPPATPLSLRLDWESLEHRSQMGPVIVSLRDSRVAASAAISF